MAAKDRTVSGLGERAEEARLESLPRATLIPQSDEQGTMDIKFEFQGELHVVTIRSAIYGRQKELLRGMKTDTYEDEEGRTHTVRDDYASADLIDRVFEKWVLTINGKPWQYSLPAMATLGGDPPGKWLGAFGEAFLEEVGLEDVLDSARKK